MSNKKKKLTLKDRLTQTYDDLSAVQFLFQTGDNANAKKILGYVKSDLKQQIKTL